MTSQNNSDFEKELLDLGFKKIEKDGQIYFQITKSPVVFKQDLINYFINMKDQIPHFLDNLSSYFDQNLSIMLTPVSLLSERTLLNQESPIKFMLNCPIIQYDLASMLIEKITELSIANEETHTTHIKSILHQFRWIDSLVNDHELLDRFMELIEVSQTSIKQELIGILPEIFLESHPKIVDKLLGLARNNLILFVPIIECLGLLSIPSSVIDELLNLVFSKLKDIELDCLPVAIHFLFSIATDKTLPEILNKLRKALDIDYYHKLSRANSVTDKDSPELLVLDAINSLLMSNMALKTYWVKLLDSQEGDIVYSLDVLVLIILHSQPSMKKKIEVLIKSKVQNREFKVTFIRKVIKLHLGLMTRYTMEFIHIAEFLLRGSEVEALFSEMAAAIYSEVFFKSEAYYQQEVIGSLVTHIGSGNSSEIDCALEALTLIVNYKPAAGLQFSIFIKGILDCLDKLSHDQVEKLFFILTSLCIEEGHRFDGPLANEIQMILRKQLMHASIRYKHIGIVASLAMVQKLCKFVDSSTAPVPGSSDGRIEDPLIHQAITTIKLVQTSCPKNQPYLAIAYDRLSQLIINKALNSTLVNWISDSVASTFTILFSDQYSDVPPKWPDLFKFRKWHGMSEEENDFSVIVLPTVVRHLYNPRESSHPVLMCAMFKLYKTCGYYITNTLDCIEGVLELGVVLCDQDKITELTGPKDMMECISVGLVIAMNWYRELINTFLSDRRQHPKLSQKLKDMLELEDSLGQFHLKSAFLVNYGLLDCEVKSATITPRELRKYLRPLDPDTYTLINMDYRAEDASYLGDEVILYLLENYNAYITQFAKTNQFSTNQQKALTYFAKLLNSYLENNSEDFESAECELLLDNLLVLITMHPVTPNEEHQYLSEIFDLLQDNASKSMCYSLTLKLQKTLSHIAKRIPHNPKIFKTVFTLTTNMLFFPWGKQTRNKKEIHYLVSEELYFTDTPIEVIEKYYTHLILPYLTEAEETDVNVKFPNFVNSTFATYYELINAKLVDYIGQIEHTSDLSTKEVFLTINQITNYWYHVVQASTHSNESAIHAIALRFGRNFVDMFNTKIIPFFDLHFTSHWKDVLAIFKLVQRGTRTLQTICNETKTKKDKKLVALIPPCRSKMETLLLKVKQLFKKHNMADAYSIGDLKVKNMGGQVMPSQIPNNEVFDPTQATQSTEMIENRPLKKKNKRFKHRLAKLTEPNNEVNLEEQGDDQQQEEYLAMDEYDE